MKTKVVAVFGYNNNRIYDVYKIKDLVKNKCNAEIVLIKKNITSLDRDVSPYCFDFEPSDHEIVLPLMNYLDKNSLDLIGCLPFSDKGVVGAAHVAKKLNLFGDSEATSLAMLDKLEFRKLEQKIEMNAEEYKKPFFYILHSKKELEALLSKVGPYFLKPTNEGNSRGCMKIETTRDLDIWMIDHSNSLKVGVICEEVLSNKNEYSFDGVNGAYWITKKFTTEGSYRAEYQHVVPAPFNTEENNRIYSILTPFLKKLGSNGGAFHHEFFILDDNRVASVEPNRRPAGMWLWDLASWAFDGFNPWEQWIDLCSNRNPKGVDLKKNNFAGVRGVISKKDGAIHFLQKERAAKELAKIFGDNFRLSFLKEEKSIVRKEPRDNSDFLAFIAIKNKNYEKLLSDLELAEKIILNCIEVS
ncbi:MAG: hypothetical protein V4596_14085 [Bdellovibrionota bacterium]